MVLMSLAVRCNSLGRLQIIQVNGSLGYRVLVVRVPRHQEWVPLLRTLVLGTRDLPQLGPHLAPRQHVPHAQVLHVGIPPQRVLLVHLAPQVPPLLRLQFVDQPRRTEEVVREEVLLVELLVVRRALHVRPGQVTGLLVEVHLGPYVLGLGDACVGHDEAGEGLGAAGVEAVGEGVLVREQDGVSVRPRREVNVPVLPRLLVDNSVLLGRRPLGHFHVSHHAHRLVRREDNPAVIDVHRLLYLVAEQMHGVEFGQGPFVFRYGILRPLQGNDYPTLRLALAVPLIHVMFILRVVFVNLLR
mmetsp:Transcript_425/g.988  ORF Transcript_425/g.988 Transcript_425/m.988 type:complete len:300 (-) Transcript_425:206-1105(-)